MAWKALMSAPPVAGRASSTRPLPQILPVDHHHLHNVEIEIAGPSFHLRLPALSEGRNRSLLIASGRSVVIFSRLQSSPMVQRGHAARAGKCAWTVGEPQSSWRFATTI